MNFTHCLFIDRRTIDGNTDFTDLPFDDLAQLTSVAEAALWVPYVTSVRISQKTSELEGKPWWGKSVFEKNSSEIGGNYTTEDQFRQDLKADLDNDSLFEQIYQAKEEYKRLLNS